MKNHNKKLICLLMALVFVLGTVCAVSAGADGETVPKRTIMVYAVGSNLEANSYLFTDKIDEFLNSPYNENLDMIVITGGTTEWHTPAEYLDGAEEIDVEYDQIWKVVGKKDGEEHGVLKLIEPTGMPGYEKANMGAPETLTAFIDYCFENYPADIYDIILWDHGGGPVGGYGRDDRFETIIRLPQLAGAFSDSKLIREGKRFELIDFDACLMSNVTVVTALSPFADYLVLSPEVEYAPAQRHLRMLETLLEDPSISGFEMGKILVDDFADYFDWVRATATLSVIDAKNFRERLLPLVRELDGILISEAAKAGKNNYRYNFYDEMYSELYSCVFGQDVSSLYDLGNLVGALSVPMSEMDNISADERSEFENAYTDVAKRILAVLSDCDGSGDDVLYFRCSNSAFRTVGAGVVRGADGSLVYADDDGRTVVVPTGLSILFADKNVDMSLLFVTRVREILDADYSEDEIDFFKGRLTATAYYGLIYDLGSTVSEMNSSGMGSVTYPDVKSVLVNDGSWDILIAPLIDWLVEAGEFAGTDEAEEYLADIVAQQNLEALSADKVDVRPIENPDGSSDSYQVTVNNSSAQVLMSVDAMSNVTLAGNETPEYLGFFNFTYGGHSREELFPDGMSFDLVTDSGELYLAPYYFSANDTLAELYERIYSSSTSVWTLPKMTEECIVLYDLDGAAHLVDLHYLDESHETAYTPISICTPEADWYGYGKLILHCEDGEWSISGVCYVEEDLLSFVIPPSEAGLENYLITTGAYMTDVIFGATATVPVGTYFPVDVTKDDLGFSFGKAKLSELDDVAGFRSGYVLSDVYGGRLNVGPAFEAADEAAKEGDFVRDISVTDITVADTVFNGEEASPDVTVIYGGRTLENGVDYKVIFDGSSDPGTAYLTVLGIGDFCGALDLTYTIRDSLEVRVDGTEIGSGDYTVDEETGDVTLTEEYLKTLAAGDHTLTVILSGTETTTDFTVHPFEYSVTEGNGVELAKNSGKDLYFRTDAETGKFSAVRIDGAEVGAGNYIAGEDGTVTMKAAFLNTLSEGGHTITLVFSDGEASANFTVLAATGQIVISPQTGVDSHTGLWIILMAVCSVGSVSLFLLAGRKKVSGK